MGHLPFRGARMKLRITVGNTKIIRGKSRLNNWGGDGPM